MWIVILLLIPLIGALLLTALFFFQTALIFPATKNIYRTPLSTPFNWQYEDIFLSVGLEKTHCWYIPLEGAHRTVLFSHGNAGNIADRLESIQLLRELGFSVFAYDYGGYGLSSGKASENRIYSDIEAVWDYLTKIKHIAPQQIIIFGRSLGGAATAHLASRIMPAAVILESTFCSIPDVVRDMSFGTFLAHGIQHHFPSLKRISLIRSPILIIHSPDDTMIPFKHGTTLFETANNPKMFLEIHGEHNNGFVLSKDIYISGWKNFLDMYVPEN
jgi:uncharacterized protein